MIELLKKTEDLLEFSLYGGERKILFEIGYDIFEDDYNFKTEYTFLDIIIKEKENVLDFRKVKFGLTPRMADNLVLINDSFNTHSMQFNINMLVGHRNEIKLYNNEKGIHVEVYDYVNDLIDKMHITNI
jgi:hypothetical protein